jgi:hypothetical protein
MLPGQRTIDISICAGNLLSLAGSWPLFPLLLVCAGSISILAAWPGKATNGWIRLGVFSGVVLSVEYWIVFVVAAVGADSWPSVLVALPTSLIVSGSMSGIIVVGGWFVGISVMMAARLLRVSIGCAASAAILLAMLTVLANPYLIWFFAVVCLLCSTPWAAAAYVSAAFWLVRGRKGRPLQYTLWQLLAAMTWLAVHFAAWRTAIVMVLARMN